MNAHQQLLHALALLQDMEGTKACGPRVKIEEKNSYTVQAYLHTWENHYDEDFVLSSDLMSKEERAERLDYLIEIHREWKARRAVQDQEFQKKEAAKKKLSAEDRKFLGLN